MQGNSLPAPPANRVTRRSPVATAAGPDTPSAISDQRSGSTDRRCTNQRREQASAAAPDVDSVVVAVVAVRARLGPSRVVGIVDQRPGAGARAARSVIEVSVPEPKTGRESQPPRGTLNGHE